MSDAADGPARILVVDDEALNVDLLEQELEAEGYATLSAASGEEALRIAQREGPDLVLLDVMMPGIDGIETCRRLKADPQTRDVPVVFTTALAGLDDVVRAFEAGGVDYVT